MKVKDSYITGADEYNVFITLSDKVTLMFTTTARIAHNRRRDTTAVYRPGSATLTYAARGGRSFAFSFSLQAGEAEEIVRQAREKTGMEGINGFADFPPGTGMTVRNLNTGTVKQFIDCTFSVDSEGIEREAVETLTAVSGSCRMIVTKFKD